MNARYVLTEYVLWPAACLAAAAALGVAAAIFFEWLGI